MSELAGFGFLMSVVMALGVAAMRARRTLDAELRRSFEALTFETPEGRVTGTSVRVVKIVTHHGGDDSATPMDLFWYCVGPGSSYFVALGHVERPRSPARVKWVVRPLTETRMRGALVGDDEAFALAFGSAVEG